MNHTREEGEISDSDKSNCEEQDVDVYTPITRPISDACVPRNTCQSIPSSEEESSSSESDSDIMFRPKRRKIKNSQMEIERNGSNQSHPIRNGPHSKNNIWVDVLQEEELTLEIRGVGLKKFKCDRSVESYDYSQAQKLFAAEHQRDDDVIEEWKEEFEETKEDVKKRLMRKRRFYDCSAELKEGRKRQLKPRHLADIEEEDSWDNEQLGGIIANALYEQKPELIVRVVEVLGKAKALELYSKTQKVEKDGGMMIMNGSRRRTSGGVYLQLLKNLDGVDKSHLSQIFISDDNRETQQWRKRKRVNRNRNRGKSKSENGEKAEDDGLTLNGPFPDDAEGTKCPGSTPVTSPTGSDNEEGDCRLVTRMKEDPFFPLKEACERAASEMGINSRESPERFLDSDIRHDEMETC